MTTTNFCLKKKNLRKLKQEEVEEARNLAKQVQKLLLPTDPRIQSLIKSISVNGSGDQERDNPPEAPRSLWAPDAIHSTVRRGEWIYELTEPARFEGGFLVEIRRASRDEWRPGAANPFYVVQGTTALVALDAARMFVRDHG